jgi:hypothetical protein
MNISADVLAILTLIVALLVLDIAALLWSPDSRHLDPNARD